MNVDVFFGRNVNVLTMQVFVGEILEIEDKTNTSCH